MGITRKHHAMGISGRGSLAGRFTRNIDYNSDYYDGFTRKKFPNGLGETGDEIIRRLREYLEPDTEKWRKLTVRMGLQMVTYCTDWQYVTISDSSGNTIDVPEIHPGYVCPNGSHPGGSSSIDYYLRIASDGTYRIESWIGLAYRWDGYDGYWDAYPRYRFENSQVVSYYEG